MKKKLTKKQKEKNDAWNRLVEIESYLRDKYLDSCGGWVDEMLSVYPDYKKEYNKLLKIISKK